MDSQLLKSLTQSAPNIYNDIDMPLVVRIESLIPIITAVSLISSSVYVKRCIAPWLRFWCLLERQTDRQTETHRERQIQIRMIYSFRPLPLMKGCGWMTYHLTVHTIIVPMSNKTNKLTTMYLTPY